MLCVLFQVKRNGKKHAVSRHLSSFFSSWAALLLELLFWLYSELTPNIWQWMLSSYQLHLLWGWPSCWTAGHGGKCWTLSSILSENASTVLPPNCINWKVKGLWKWVLTIWKLRWEYAAIALLTGHALGISKGLYVSCIVVLVFSLFTVRD